MTTFTCTCGARIVEPAIDLDICQGLRSSAGVLFNAKVTCPNPACGKTYLSQLHTITITRFWVIAPPEKEPARILVPNLRQPKIG